MLCLRSILTVRPFSPILMNRKVGDTLCYGRYRLTDTLGDGTFGRCLEAVDTRKHPSEKNYRVAIKVVRDVQRYTEAAQIEADILEEVAREDRKGESRCVELLGTFMHGPHYCFVFERLGESLFEFLKANDYRGFCVQDIQVFARQTLECLRFLHSIRLTHTDLKPENILLVDSSSREITFPRVLRCSFFLLVPFLSFLPFFLFFWFRVASCFECCGVFLSIVVSALSLRKRREARTIDRKGKQLLSACNTNVVPCSKESTYTGQYSVFPVPPCLQATFDFGHEEACMHGQTESGRDE